MSPQTATNADGEAPLVDTHFHLWTPDLPLTDTAWHRELSDASVERFTQILDAHGVIFGVVAAASLHGYYNDYVRSALRRYRRLRATAMVHPDTDIYTLQKMRDDGFVGIRFVWNKMDEVPDLSSGQYRAFLRRVADLGWHVHINERPERVEQTIQGIERSGAPLVVDHMGHYELPEGINSAAFQAVLRAVDRGNTWVKLSAGFRYSSPAAAATYAAELIRTAGGERLMWGSDWPFAAFEDIVQYGDTIAALKAWVPDIRLRRQISGETPLRFYFA